MAAIGTGGSTAGNADVNTDFELQVALSKTLTKAGYVALVAENDAGSLFATKRVKQLQTSEDSRLQVGQVTPIFNYSFNATAQDTGVWRYVTSTMTTTWSGTGVLLNANQVTASTNGTMVSTWRQFGGLLQGGQRFDFQFSLTASLLANQEITLAWSPFGAGNAVPTEGVYVKLSSAGLFGFSNFNSSEANTTGQMDIAASFLQDTTYRISIIVYERAVLFLRDGILLANGVLNIPAAAGQTTGTGCFPLSIQFRNSNTVSGSPVAQLKVLDVAVSQLDVNLGISYPTLQTIQGLMGSQGTNGNTQGSTALLTNNLAAGAGAAMTNTTAALGTGLGGQFSALPTLAVGTDGILDSYQVPIGSINVTPRSLLIYGVRIQGCVTTVLAGNATAVSYLYSLAYGHTTVSAATAEGVASKATRRDALGFESYAAAAAVGTIGQGVYMPFTSPRIVNPGEFVAILAKNLGVVTTTGVITFSVTFDAQWI
jgi:hypothetical protein